MKTKLEKARAFSGGKFEDAEPFLADQLQWEIFEEQKHFKNKQEAKDFYQGIAEYFASIETDFKEYGVVESNKTVAIYGHGRFIRNGKLVNEVNSCDVFEFDGEGKINYIRSYCNSIKPGKE